MSRYPSSRGLAADDEPPRATGQYPDPVWADAAAVALADDDVPEPPSATGQYPDPVWADAAGRALAADDDVPEPPRATGQYPGPVWADETAAAALSGPEGGAPRPDDRRREPEYDPRLALPALDAAQHPASLGIPELFAIVRQVVAADSGDDGYAAILTDEAYAGDPAYAGRRFGLQWGLALFPQSSGLLGEVLRLTQSRDAAAFDALFGPDSLALLRVTTATDPAARMDPVGEPLTAPSWTERFRAAGADESCRRAQNEVAIERMLRPALRPALAMGLDTPRGLAMALDRVSVRGLGGGVRWLLDAAGLLATPAEVERAVAALGFAELAAFQERSGSLPATGEAGTETRVALLEAIRSAGIATLPDSAEVQARLLAAATGGARRRLQRIQGLAGLADSTVR